MDLQGVFNAFDGNKPLPGDDDRLYVDLSGVRGDVKVPQSLLQLIVNAEGHPSHHLLMGHTKCGKSTELLRTARFLEEEGFASVYFDVAELGTPELEYSSVLLFMAAQIVQQLAERASGNIFIDPEKVGSLEKFLVEKQVTQSQGVSGGAKGQAVAEVGQGLLTSLLGKLGLSLELSGGFERSRAITTKIEADRRGFIRAVRDLIHDAVQKALQSGYRGLVVVCDGCDKLSLSATDEQGVSHDLQRSMFIEHANDLRSIPCHVIYTVPISIQAPLESAWNESPEFVPAIPVNKLENVAASFSERGREALREVVGRRLHAEQTSAGDLFATPDLLEMLISVSGGHISDLFLLIRQAVLATQVDQLGQVGPTQVEQSITKRAFQFDRLIEPRHLKPLVLIDQLKTAVNSEDYRDLIFKHLVLQYVCGSRRPVELHPLVAASDVYVRWRSVDYHEAE